MTTPENKSIDSLYHQLIALGVIMLVGLGAAGLIQQQIIENRNTNLLTQATQRLTNAQLAASDGFNLDQFSSPISSVSVTDGTLSVADTLVYDTAYVQTADGGWQQVTLSGNAQTSVWYINEAQAELPAGTTNAPSSPAAGTTVAGTATTGGSTQPSSPTPTVPMIPATTKTTRTPQMRTKQTPKPTPSPSGPGARTAQR
jgi:cytoskeletal protein RodZ